MKNRSREIRPDEPGWEEQKAMWAKQRAARQRRIENIRMIVKFIVSATTSVLTVLLMKRCGMI